MSILARLQDIAAARVWLAAYIAEERRQVHGEMGRYWRSAGYSAILAILAAFRLRGVR